MADGNRTWARVPHDMGANKIEHLGRSTVADGAARIDDIPTASTEAPLADGIADPGDTAAKRYAAEKHVHPLVPASATGGKLWTGWVDDPLSHAAVDACFIGYYVCGDPILFSVGWTQIETGVWQKDATGDLSSQFTDDVAPFLGMRLLAWPATNPEALSNADRIASGPYVLTDTGATTVDPITHVPTYHHATLQRAPDFCTSAQALHGAYVYVTGGAICHGRTYQLSTADPIELNVTALNWEIVTPPTPAPTNELLTASQLSLAAAYNCQATAFASGDTHEVELQIFTEHDTALGGQTFPADGPIRAHMPLSLWTDDPYADTVVHLYLRAHAPAGDEAWVPVATTQALHNTELGVFVAVGTMGSAYPIPIGSSLQARYTVETNSVTGINIDFLYNDPAHKSFIELPLIIGFSGTSRHPELSERDALDQHAMDSGSITPAAPRIVTTVDGFLTLPSLCTSVVQLMGTEPLLGISTREGNYSGIPLTLFILQATTTDPNNAERDPFRVLTNHADMTGHAGFSNMDFGMMGMAPAAVDNPFPNYELTMYSCLQLVCLGGTWWPVAPAFVYQSP